MLFYARAKNKIKHKNAYSDFYDRFYKFRDNLIFTDSDIDYLISITKESLNIEIKNLIKKSSNEGKEQALKDIRKIYKNKNLNEISVIDITLNTFYEKSDITIKNIFSDIKKKLDGNREKENVEIVLNALEYRFRYLIEYILPKAKWYSYIKICNAAKIKKVKVNFGNSNDSEKHNEIINTNAFSLDMIPAYHPFCDCKLKLEKNEV